MGSELRAALLCVLTLDQDIHRAFSGTHCPHPVSDHKQEPRALDWEHSGTMTKLRAQWLMNRGLFSKGHSFVVIYFLRCWGTNLESHMLYTVCTLPLSDIFSPRNLFLTVLEAGKPTVWGGPFFLGGGSGFLSTFSCGGEARTLIQRESSAPMT